MKKPLQSPNFNTLNILSNKSYCITFDSSAISGDIIMVINSLQALN